MVATAGAIIPLLVATSSCVTHPVCLPPSLPQAFSKVTHQEPEHGEAWANLSALWLQQGGWREALHAAEQAVKLKRESWQTWENYALAASKAGAPTACVRGLAEVCCVFLCVWVGGRGRGRGGERSESESRQNQCGAACVCGHKDADTQLVWFPKDNRGFERSPAGTEGHGCGCMCV